MKKEIPGYLRELLVAILIPVPVLAFVFRSLSSRWRSGNAEENRGGEAQETTVTNEEMTDSNPGERSGALQ